MRKRIIKKKKPVRIRLKVRNFKDPKYIEWRKKVYKRDNYKCQWPGCKGHGRLNAHHIRRWSEFPTLRYVVDNGISLCYIHHKSITGHEDDFAIMFIKILQTKAQKNV